MIPHQKTLMKKGNIREQSSYHPHFWYQLQVWGFPRPPSLPRPVANSVGPKTMFTFDTNYKFGGP